MIIYQGKPKIFNTGILINLDGMISNKCVATSPQTSTLTKDGIALFSTSKGLVEIKPSMIKQQSQMVSLYFDKIMVNGKPFALKNIKRLEPNPFRVEFSFGTINFYNPDKLNFKCRLSGIDKDWIALGDNKSVGYSHLPYGNYKFKLVGYDKGNNAELASTEINFFIEPYFWETSSFRFFSFLGFVLLLILVTRFLNKRKYERRIKTLEAETALEKERTRISANMHDELGASLTKVSILLGMAKETI